ncbi:podocan-like [Amphiura filiformis]|uniref:podocan-like n=1 Tax=Amphiura filiformis TaxID=82378 RepID=UPI003B20EFD1
MNLVYRNGSVFKPSCRVWIESKMATHAKIRLLLQVHFAVIWIGRANGLITETVSGHLGDKQMCYACNCNPIDEYQFIDCSSRQLQDIPSDFPANTIQLNIEHNQIRSQIELPSSVLHLYGRDNQLTDIFGMFHKTSKIRVVILVENRITSIPKGTFASCYQMTELYLSDNPIKYFNADSFIGLNSLYTLEMDRINGIIVETDLFREIRHSLRKLKLGTWRELSQIEAGAFNFSLQRLRLSAGSLTYFPGGIFAPSQGNVNFDYCSIEAVGKSVTGISAKAFTGVRQVRELTLTGHSLKHLPQDLFANTSITPIAYLDNNDLEDLPVGFMKLSPQLELLSLNSNRLKYISSDILMGLDGLKYLYLFQNLIMEVPPLTFYKTSLKELCIFNNNISSIRKSALDTSNKTLESVYMYYNDIIFIEDNALDGLANNGTIYLSTSHLSKWTQYPDNVNVFAVGDYINISLSAYNKLYRSMAKFGFQCKDYQCFPCTPGTYGNQIDPCCINCPAGGYFQERSGQVSKDPGGIGCKLCTNGTFVSPYQAPGRRAADCEVCPTGTKRIISQDSVPVHV